MYKKVEIINPLSIKSLIFVRLLVKPYFKGQNDYKAVSLKATMLSALYIQKKKSSKGYITNCRGY